MRFLVGVIHKKGNSLERILESYYYDAPRDYLGELLCLMEDFAAVDCHI